MVVGSNLVAVPLTLSFQITFLAMVLIFEVSLAVNNNNNNNNNTNNNNKIHIAQWTDIS